MKFLEDALCKNNEGDGFFVGDKVSVSLDLGVSAYNLYNVKKNNILGQFHNAA